MSVIQIRRFFAGACVGAVALLLGPHTANAGLDCSPPFLNGVRQCTAGIKSEPASTVFAFQEQTQWCWAAAIQMVFAYHGYSVQQTRIVSEVWGAPFNMPGQPAQILASLNRVWTDDFGKRFRSRGKDYDANVVTAAQDLARDKPLIVGTMGHAMMLTAMTYTGAGMNVGINSLVVRDPWFRLDAPLGRRVLMLQEFVSISFLARVDVEPLTRPIPPAVTNSCQHANDGMCDEPGLCAPGTDAADCSGHQSASTSASRNDSCAYSYDGKCDEPDICAFGTDMADCRAAPPPLPRPPPSPPAYATKCCDWSGIARCLIFPPSLPGTGCGCPGVSGFGRACH